MQDFSYFFHPQNRYIRKMPISYNVIIIKYRQKDLFYFQFGT